MSSAPLISVIVPCYNHGKYLNSALDSILAQTYANWECIIINDGSTDNSEKVAKDYLNRDLRFKYVQKQNGGLSSARNAGLSASSGQYIQFLDADDFIHQDKLMLAVEVLDSKDDIRLILSDYQLYDDKTKKYLCPNFDLSKLITYESVITNWDVTFAIPIHCGIIDKNLINDGFDESLKAKEDWLMWIRIFEQIRTYHFENKFLAYYRLHNNNMIKNFKLMNENSLSAYLLVHQMITSSELKNSVFKRYAALSLENMKSLQKNYDNVLSSNSYKTGNFLLTPFSFFKRSVKKIFSHSK